MPPSICHDLSEEMVLPSEVSCDADCAVRAQL